MANKFITWLDAVPADLKKFFTNPVVDSTITDGLNVAAIIDPALAPLLVGIAASGTGASGTWGINFTGNSGNTSSVSNATGGSYTWTNTNYFQSNQNTGGGSSPPLEAYSTGGNGAIMAFHRGGVYAVNMGLDSDNVFRIGGWSASYNLLQMDRFKRQHIRLESMED